MEVYHSDYWNMFVHIWPQRMLKWDQLNPSCPFAEHTKPTSQARLTGGKIRVGCIGMGLIGYIWLTWLLDNLMAIMKRAYKFVIEDNDEGNPSVYVWRPPCLVLHITAAQIQNISCSPLPGSRLGGEWGSLERWDNGRWLRHFPQRLGNPPVQWSRPSEQVSINIF